MEVSEDVNAATVPTLCGAIAAEAVHSLPCDWLRCALLNDLLLAHISPAVHIWQLVSGKLSPQATVVALTSEQMEQISLYV